MPDFDAILKRARGEPESTTAPARRRPLALVGVSEVAAMLGCSRQYASKLAHEPPAGFPAPLETLRSGPVWDRRRIEDWQNDR